MEKRSQKAFMKHQSVLLNEAVAQLQIKNNNWYVDATFGRGGHTSEIIRQGGHVLAFDVDQTAIEYANQQFTQEIETGKLIVVRENFEKLASVVRKLQDQQSITEVSGVLFDFGTSSEQLTSSERGFSFQGDGLLDMRMDDRLGVTAADLLAVLNPKQLAEVFWNYGGEPKSKQIAAQIVKLREKGLPVRTTQQLAEVVSRIVPRTGKLHPATKVFQALRIAVNSELDVIETGLKNALEVTQTQGRIATISFHEGEDRLAKTAFKKWDEAGLGKIITSKPLSPSQAEIDLNPRSRSAKLRVFEKK